MIDGIHPHGYILDASYPTTFFRELSPVWLNYVAALNGAAPRELGQTFTYLELGCGTGFSSLVHAAAFPSAEFHACDFNPICIAACEQRAGALAIRNVRFHEASFDELLTRNLPEFDFIVLHGVYSWVDNPVQQSIRQLIRENLKPGGLVYLSYNCLPGWTCEVPLRKLLLEFAAASKGDSSQRTEHAVHTLKRLRSSGLEFFRANPSAITAVDAYARSDSSYMAHEFLDEAWEPRYSVDVADEMMEAEVSYLGSATLVDNHEPLIIDSSTAEAISGLETARQRQLATDFAVNRQFRRDVFVRPSENDENVDVARNLSDVVIGCLGNPATISTTIQVPRGRVNFHADFIQELRPLMSRGPATLRQVATALGGEIRNSGEIVRNLLYLVAAGVLTPFAKPFGPTGSHMPREFASTTVKRMFEDVAHADGPGQIASEVVGSAIEMRPNDAAAVIEYLTGRIRGEPKTALAELLPRLLRLGLLK